MKRLWIVTAVLLVLLLGGITAWRLLPRGGHDVSDLYSECATQQGVRAGFIENYRFDDSTLVDVTTVEALDSLGWAWMQRRFDLPEPDSSRAAKLASGDDVLFTAPFADDRQYLFLSYSTRSLCVVSVDNDSQLKSVVRYHIQLLKQ